MEIRQVLKSSASMIPDLFYKVSDETREKNRESGGKGWKERRMSRREEGRKKKKTSMEADVWKNPHIWRGGRNRKGRKRGRIEDRRRTKREQLNVWQWGRGHAQVPVRRWRYRSPG